ncbi:MAG: hypothetical protein M1838_003009 [Thelocarpon superellum]|nr:MAG: hypothetical protein M1838_003009 [Thelocarpon superellum]
MAASDQHSSIASTEKMPDAAYVETVSTGTGLETGSGASGAGGPKKVGASQRIKTHFRRFWWLHLIIFLAGALLLTLLLVYVAEPRIAQTGVNESTLEIDSMVLTDPTPTSFHLHQTQVLHNYNMYHPYLDGFNASLFLEDTEPNIIPFAYIQVPGVSALSDSPMVLDQTVQIVDLDQYTRYTKLVLQSEEYRVAIRGRPLLHEARYPATYVDYNEVVTLKGLNGLKGFNVTQFQILLSPAPDGANLIGTAYIPNPSVLTIAMGNVTFNLSVQGDFIGTTTIENLTLVPGNNTVPMRSTTNQSLVIEKLTQFPDGFLPIDVLGNSSVYNGQHLPYYEAALATNPQHISLNVGGALGGGLKL